MLIQPSVKTSWFNLGVVIICTGIALYFIKQAFDQPFIQFQTTNEVHAAEIKKMLVE